MSRGLIALVAVIYLVTAAIKAKDGQWPKAMMWFAYAVANIGLMIDD